MTKIALRSSILGILLVSLAALPAMAQPPIPAGSDYWVTPANGQTVFEFPEGDVESLCGAPISAAWDHKVALRGVPTVGSDWDTRVARLDNAVFDTTGTAVTRIQVKDLNLASIAAHATPCRRINWKVSLACCPQPITRMVLRSDATGGGVFHANLSVSVEFKAFNADNGAYIGSLFYTRELPDQASGTPWSYGGPTGFRPGITTANTCIDVLRQKLSQFAPTSSHYYWISDMIAQGICHKPT
jgi:hypothetical protein